MGTFSIWHWLIVLAVVLVLFGGGGKLSRLMGDFGKGLKSFKKQMRDDKEEGNEQKTLADESAPEQTGQPEPPHKKHSMSISALGSVNGKCEALNLVRTASPNIRRAKSVNVPFRSPKVMLYPTAKPST